MTELEQQKVDLVVDDGINVTQNCDVDLVEIIITWYEV